MKKKWVYIAVETAVRELDSKILLSLEFLYRNYNVVIGSRQNIEKMHRYLPEGLFFLKDSASFNHNKYKKLREKGNKIVVHDEEGFVTGSDEEYMNDRLRNNTIKEVDIYFAWGERQKKLIEKVFNEREINLDVKCVGHPRVDILREEFILQKQNFNRILINTKTAGANYRGGSDKLLDDYTRLEYIKNEKDLKFYKDYIEYDKKLFESYKLLIKELSLSFQDKEIILRSHPNENENTWKEIFSSYKNVIVTREDSVNSWIEKSDVVIHTGCTTGVEASLMNSIVLAYIPFADKNYDITFPNDVSIKVFNIKDTIDNIQKVYDTSFENRKELIPLEKKEILSYYVSNIEGKLSTEYILDEIDKLIIPIKDIDKIGKLKIFVRNIFNNLKGNKEDKKFSNIDIQLLRRKMSRYSNRYSYLETIKIEKIYNNVYILSRDK